MEAVVICNYNFGRSAVYNSPIFMGEVVWGCSTQRFVGLNTKQRRTVKIVCNDEYIYYIYVYSRCRPIHLLVYIISTLQITNVENVDVIPPYKITVLQPIFMLIGLLGLSLKRWKYIRVSFNKTTYITYMPTPWHSRHLPVHQLQRVAWRACGCVEAHGT